MLNVTRHQKVVPKVFVVPTVTYSPEMVIRNEPVRSGRTVVLVIGGLTILAIVAVVIMSLRADRRDSKATTPSPPAPQASEAGAR